MLLNGVDTYKSLENVTLTDLGIKFWIAEQDWLITSCKCWMYKEGHRGDTKLYWPTYRVLMSRPAMLTRL